MAPNLNSKINSIVTQCPELTEREEKSKDKSVYNAKVDPCHPSYDASQVDTSKLIPNYGSKLQHSFYIVISYFLNWLPFAIVMDCVIGLFWCPNDRYYTTQWGILKTIWKQHPSILIQAFSYYLSIVTILFSILYYINCKNQHETQYLMKNVINNPKNCNDTSKIVSEINRLHASTTRVIHNPSKCGEYGSDILIIGTSHLSESSGKQVSQLIQVLNSNSNSKSNVVCSVVLELDELRYLRMRMGDAKPNLYNATLARDLLKISTYMDPITLFARIGTHLTAYFVEPGMEFRHAANIAIEKNIDIVYGDQELEKTVESIGKNTPKWLVLLLNLFIITSYGFPIVSAISHLYFVFSHDNATNLLTKLMVSFIFWNLMYYPIYLIIRVFTEQSKLGNGMKRISCFLKVIARILPCLAKVFKKSDFKTVRDETLAKRTMKTAEKNQNGTVVVAVVGLAHMNDMAEIITNQYGARDTSNNCKNSIVI